MDRLHSALMLALTSTHYVVRRREQVGGPMRAVHLPPTPFQLQLHGVDKPSGVDEIYCKELIERRTSCTQNKCSEAENVSQTMAQKQ